MYGVDINVNDDEQTISGHWEFVGPIHDSTAKLYTCDFYFYGKLQKDGSAIILANEIGPGDGAAKVKNKSVQGRVYPVITGQDAIIIELDHIFHGCKHIKGLSNKEQLNRTMGPDTGIDFRVIAPNKRSYFYNSPRSKKQRKDYVTCGDFVTVIDKDKASGRVRAEHNKPALGTTTGWLSEKDLLGVGEALDCKQ